MNPCARTLLPLFLISSAAVWAAEARDLVVGTWNLNVAKSKYNPGPAPQKETRVYQPHPEGIKVTITTVSTDGQSKVVEYTAENDGKEYPITGRGYINAITLTKLNEYEAAANLMHSSVVAAKATRTIAPDGKTMTIRYKGTNGEAEQVDNISVYNKQ